MATPAPDINVYFTQHSDALPLWLQVLVGIVACVAGLLLLTCLLLCCMRLCGCWTGNILGVGALKRPLDDTDHIGCWCCRPPTIARGRRVDDENGSYIIQYKNSRKSTPVTPKDVWMPHSQPVRNNNTSTH